MTARFGLKLERRRQVAAIGRLLQKDLLPCRLEMVDSIFGVQRERAVAGWQTGGSTS